MSRNFTCSVKDEFDLINRSVFFIVRLKIGNVQPPDSLRILSPGMNRHERPVLKSFCGSVCHARTQQCGRCAHRTRKGDVEGASPGVSDGGDDLDVLEGLDAALRGHFEGDQDFFAGLQVPSHALGGRDPADGLLRNTSPVPGDAHEADGAEETEAEAWVDLETAPVGDPAAVVT